VMNGGFQKVTPDQSPLKQRAVRWQGVEPSAGGSGAESANKPPLENSFRKSAKRSTRSHEKNHRAIACWKIFAIPAYIGTFAPANIATTQKGVVCLGAQDGDAQLITDCKAMMQT